SRTGYWASTSGTSSRISRRERALSRFNYGRKGGERLVEVEPAFEGGHRRIIRAWSALGERSLALRHYEEMARWLRNELQTDPDPVTQSLANDLRAHALHRTAASRHALDRQVARTAPYPVP
ncbi:MAG: hypothetical protein HY701_10205, partial [Gemmatimonadetes bacterium]|nr:hypothetical protein [Gemmatimonadota bacterium]